MSTQDTVNQVRRTVAENPVSLKQAFEPGASSRDPGVSRAIDDAAAAATAEKADISEAHHGGGTRRAAGQVLANALSGRQLTPKQRLRRDEIGFVAGVANIALSAFWMGRDPATFYRWWTAKAVILFGIRYLIYQAQKEHYYLLEMCYLVNVVLGVYVWVVPGSVWLYKAAFGLVAGPLTWSIVALRNSLVMHSLDQMTSLFMHASPGMVIWALRWYPSDHIQNLAAMDPEAAKAFSSGGFRDIVGNAMVLYLVWAVVYYLKIFVVSKQKIQEEGYSTLYSYMTRNKKGAVARLVFSVPKPFQPLVYMGFHAAMATAATCTAVLWFHSYWAHTIFLTAVLLAAAYNGATYYFHIFANRYVKSMGLDPKGNKTE